MVKKEKPFKIVTKTILSAQGLKVTARFLFGSFVYMFMMLTTIWWAPFIVSLFTREDKEEKDFYKWGWIYGTFDNPPQGDRRFLEKHPETKGVKGWWNRSMWIFRNKLYNLKLKFSVTWEEGYVKTIYGNPDISDKYKVPGWLFVTVVDRKGKLVAWEWYSVSPYSEKRNVRCRMGWKIKGDKFDEVGERVQLVFTFNPVDGYGNEK